MSLSKVKFETSQIAPCGINCGTCFAYLRERNKCPGCLDPSNNKPKTSLNCKIKNCENPDKRKSKYCYDAFLSPARD